MWFVPIFSLTVDDGFIDQFSELESYEVSCPNLSATEKI